MNNPKPGEIWLADLGLTAKTRPVIIVSRFDSNPPRMLITYVPLTTQYRQSRYEIEIPDLHFLNKKTYANVQGIGSLPIVRLERKIGELPFSVMQEVKSVIKFALDLAE